MNLNIITKHLNETNELSKNNIIVEYIDTDNNLYTEELDVDVNNDELILKNIKNISEHYKLVNDESFNSKYEKINEDWFIKENIEKSKMFINIEIEDNVYYQQSCFWIGKNLKLKKIYHKNKKCTK